MNWYLWNLESNICQGKFLAWISRIKWSANSLHVVEINTIKSVIKKYLDKFMCISCCKIFIRPGRAGPVFSLDHYKFIIRNCYTSKLCRFRSVMCRYGLKTISRLKRTSKCYLPSEVPPHFSFLRARYHFRAKYYFAVGFALNCCTISLSLSMMYPFGNASLFVMCK